MKTVMSDGKIVITSVQNWWEISTVSLSFLDWIRDTFGDYEDREWKLLYYNGSMSLIKVTDERIITMTVLRWA